MSRGGPLIIAEIGTAHGGDICRARELIDAAARSGADAAKFQIVYASEILHPASGSVKLPGGSVPLYERFQSLEREAGFYAELKEITEAAGLLFICSPFGIKSARVLRRIETAVFKIASPELNHFPLLEEVAGYGRPVILSSGVSTLGDIEKALTVIRKSSRAPQDAFVPVDLAALHAQSRRILAPLSLLHCITAYPAPEEEYNLKVIPNLAALFGIPVGVSDHSADPVLVPALAALHGAALIEKHFTLDTSGGGLDDIIALTPGKFAGMVREVRAAETEAAAGRAAEVIEAFEAAYGRDRVRRVLGNGVKTLAPSEAENYSTTRRGVHALRQIPEGECFTEENTALLRSEKNLRPGLPPDMWTLILGRAAARTVPAGAGIVWDDLLPPPQSGPLER
ncbi:MAG: N-acetylneuraminate synthase family protein [Spirochaetales bacterium]|jgi:N-acetylneuraminate synthase|nr:N-acetylneuraminate synthase family protein [Spirochaetales bacterium]